MNFKVLNEDIYFPNEFVKLNEIRGEFLQLAFNSVSTFTEECTKKFNSIEQLLKDGESFGYEYLNSYISKAIDIINEFGIKEIDNDTFNKKYYLNNYCTWENTLEEINNDNNKEFIDNKIEDITYAKLNINSELIRKPFKLQEKNIILDSDKIENGISIEIINKLVNSMIESIFNINFAIIDVLNYNNVDAVSSYNNAEDINKSNTLIKELLENKISKDEEVNTIKEIIKLNPYNENIYKALLYKYGDKDNQLEELGEFLGYDNIHEYKYKLLDEYYRGLPNSTKEDINKAKESIVLFSNKLGIKEYSEYVDELNKMLKDQVKIEDSIKTKEIEKTIQMATVEVNEKIRKDKKDNKKVWISTGIIGASLLVVYLIMTAYFNNHFFFRTYINGINVTGKSSKSAQALMTEKASDYVLTINERHDNTEQLSGAEISLEYDFNNEISRLLEEQNPFLWIKSMFSSNKYTMTDGISYDESLLKQILGELNCLNESNVKDPVSAYINYTDDGYEIVKEDKGNRVKYDEFYSKVLTYIQNINDVLDLDKEGCYEEPKYTSETDVVVQAKNTIDKYMSSKITYNVSGDEIVIDSSLINTWINIDEDFNVTLNEDAIKEYVNQLGDIYDNIGSTRTFTRWSGEVIKVSTTPGIYYIDRDTTISQIVEAISNGSETTKDLSFKTPTATDDYVINTFVEVDLTNQTVVYYKNGELITQGNVVTGNVSAGHATPSGVYRLDWKAKDFVLRGDGYASPVSFWMPFNGGIGLHDASWRSSFGGSIYKTNGSHGCVNMPYSVAQAIYNNIEDKTTIICRY
ncbi:L,D-transpeptidase family protein [Clostridium sp. D43t1_170807_H7]|uniref:L,D-transpeptidase family protein n=1 Tax=Clostridium sp. D43t1_170807_H7 TaxID=2787140 RepID=UPI00189B7729|nr:L,D-transpeptidase family protein [Clostridium sp. D43t1_170807_H7]